MTAEARQWRNTLRWSTNSDFFQTFGQHGLYPQETSVCYLVPGFTPSAARFIHNNIISKEVCRVLVLQCHSASFYLFCLVSSSSPILCNSTVVSTIRTVIQTTFIHTIIHSYINTFTHQCIHKHINNINQYMVASVTRILYLFSSVFTYHRVMPQVPTNEQLVIIIFIKSVIPSVSWSRDVTNQSFQAVSPKQWTA